MKKLIILILFLSLSITAYSQINAIEYAYLKTQIPEETIKIKTNTNILLAGEYLFYSASLFNSQAETFSSVSKIMYLELVNADGKPVFKHKLKLTSSHAQGSYFIPASIKTGHYKLIGYTNWSLNNTNNKSFHEVNLAIINPFITETEERNENPNTINLSKITERLNLEETSNAYSIQLNETHFGQREKVSFIISSNQVGSSYSLSVRQIDSVNITFKNSSNQAKNTNNDTYYLPELRGEIVSGQVVGSNNKPIENTTVSLTFSGEDAIFKNAKTNAEGIFYFSLTKNHQKETATLEIQDINKENYTILRHEQEFNKYHELYYNQIELNPNIKSWLEKQSVNNQIENAYYAVKTDSIDGIITQKPFYQSLQTSYMLDDYTRFKTMKETFVEIIHTAAISKQGDKHYFKVPDYNNSEANKTINNLQPLIIIDGLLIQDNETIINYSSKKINKISTISGQYIYSSKIYSGIIAFTTNYYDFSLPNQTNYIKNISVIQPLNSKQYYQPNYQQNTSLKRIPDYRKQLLWIPNLEIESKKTISLFTSDNKGTYEIILRGTTPNGVTEKTTTYFIVD